LNAIVIGRVFSIAESPEQEPTSKRPTQDCRDESFPEFNEAPHCGIVSQCRSHYIGFLTIKPTLNFFRSDIGSEPQTA